MLWKAVGAFSHANVGFEPICTCIMALSRISVHTLAAKRPSLSAVICGCMRGSTRQSLPSSAWCLAAVRPFIQREIWRITSDGTIKTGKYSTFDVSFSALTFSFCYSCFLDHTTAGNVVKLFTVSTWDWDTSKSALIRWLINKLWKLMIPLTLT